MSLDSVTLPLPGASLGAKIGAAVFPWRPTHGNSAGPAYSAAMECIIARTSSWEAYHMGVAQNLRARVTQVLVHVSTYQGSILVPVF